MGVSRRLLLMVSLLAMTAFIATAALGEDGDAYRGARVAQSWCANCHVIAPFGPSRAGDAAPPFPAIANHPGMTRARLSGWLQNLRPHTQMPKLNLSRRDIDDLIAYILSLGK